MDGFGGTVVVDDDDDCAVVVASGLSFLDGRGWKKVLMRLDMMRWKCGWLGGGCEVELNGEGRPAGRWSRGGLE